MTETWTNTQGPKGRTNGQTIQALTKALGVVKMACESVGISRQTHYNWLKEDAAYKTACDNHARSVGSASDDFADATTSTS